MSRSTSASSASKASTGPRRDFCDSRGPPCGAASWRLRAPALAFMSCPPDQNAEGEMQAAESCAEEKISVGGWQRERAYAEHCERDAHDSHEANGLRARGGDAATIEQQPHSRDHVEHAVPPQRERD